MNRNLVIGIVVVLILVAGGWYFYSKKAMDADGDRDGDMVNLESSPSDASMMASNAPSDMTESTDSSTTAGSVKEFTVTGSNFKFDTPEIKVKTGDTVKINFKNTQGFHDFVIDEFNVKTKQANGPSEETVTFVASKAGTYEYYCSVGQHRAMGMKGNLIVE